jgi:hypothetical protein
MLIDDIREVLSVPFEQVISTPLILKLLSVYSKLYLGGRQPRMCTACHRDYYIQLSKDGEIMAEKYEEAKKRTCKPKWNGLMYIRATARHWNSELLTDKEAEYLLEKGFLTPENFEVLPAKPEPVPEEKIQEGFEKRHAPKAKKQVKK